MERIICGPSYSRSYWLSRTTPIDFHLSMERGREFLRCQPCTQLPTLPPEIIGLVATHLCIPDLHRFSATSRRMSDCVAHLLLQAVVLDSERPSSRSTPVWSAPAQSHIADLPRRLTIQNYAVHLPNIDHFRFLAVLRLISCDLRQQFGLFDTVFCLRELRVLSFLYTYLPPFPTALIARIPELSITELDCIMSSLNISHIYEEDDPVKYSHLDLLYSPHLVTLRISLCQATVQFVSRRRLYGHLSCIQTLELHGPHASGIDAVQATVFCKSFTGVRRLNLVDVVPHITFILDFSLPLLDTFHGTLHNGIMSSCSPRIRHLVLRPSVTAVALSNALTELPALESFEVTLFKWDDIALTFPEQFFPNVVDLRLRYNSGRARVVIQPASNSCYFLMLHQLQIRDFFSYRLQHLPNLRVFHVLASSIDIKAYDNIVKDGFRSYWQGLDGSTLSEVRLQRHAVWRKPEGDDWNLILETTETSLGLLDDFS